MPHPSIAVVHETTIIASFANYSSVRKLNIRNAQKVTMNYPRTQVKVPIFLKVENYGGG